MNLDMELAKTQLSEREYKRLVRVNNKRRGYFTDNEWQRLEDERLEFQQRVNPTEYQVRMEVEARAKLGDAAHARAVMFSHYFWLLFKVAKVTAIIAVPVVIFAAGVVVGANFF